MTISLKNIERFEEKLDFRGCGFFDVSNIVIFSDWTNVWCTVFYAASHCGNDDFFGTKQTIIYDQITCLSISVIDFLVGERGMGGHGAGEHGGGAKT